MGADSGLAFVVDVTPDALAFDGRKTLRERAGIFEHGVYQLETATSEITPQALAQKSGVSFSERHNQIVAEATRGIAGLDVDDAPMGAASHGKHVAAGRAHLIEAHVIAARRVGQHAGIEVTECRVSVLAVADIVVSDGDSAVAECIDVPPKLLDANSSPTLREGTDFRIFEVNFEDSCGVCVSPLVVGFYGG